MTERLIGRYAIRGELGRGGMGTVYLAYDPALEREVALKLLPSYLAQDPDFSSRFAREAKTIAGLDHQAIVAVYDFGEEDVWPYFVMRYMRGGSLKDRLANGPVTLAEASKIVQRIAGALDKAHSRGVVHRDLKPANILYDAEGQPYLGDFGIVRLAETSESFTRTGNTLGTPAYMSPEQADALPDIDGRSDIYSLGVVLYEMLAGEPPYQHDSLPRLLMMHLTAPIPNLLEARPDLPPAVQDVIDKAMAKDREQRYQTAGELAAALLVIAGQQATPQATTPATLPPPPVTPTAAEEATEVMPGPPAAPPQEPVPATAKMEEEPADSSAGRKRTLALIAVAVISLTIIAIIVAVVAVNGGSSTSDGEELADNGSSLAALQRIREHGHIHVGIRESDLFPFTFGNSDEPNGFEIDLVLDLVQRVFGDEVWIEYQPLSVGSGFAALKSGEIDMMVRMTPKTTSRGADPDLLFSNNYFLDGQRLLVPRESGIGGWGELDGRRVCVLAGTTDGQTLLEFSANANINLEPIRLANSEDIFNALLRGQCDAYSANWSILENDLAQFSDISGSFQIVDRLMTREPIAIVFGNDFEFASLVDQMLIESIADGTWQTLYSSRFSDAAPWTVEEMLSEPPAER